MVIYMRIRTDVLYGIRNQSPSLSAPKEKETPPEVCLSPPKSYARGQSTTRQRSDWLIDYLALKAHTLELRNATFWICARDLIQSLSLVIKPTHIVENIDSMENDNEQPSVIHLGADNTMPTTVNPHKRAPQPVAAVAAANGPPQMAMGPQSQR